MTQEDPAEVVHARDGIYWQRNRCGEIGGKATNDAEATCPKCCAVIAGRKAKA